MKHTMLLLAILSSAAPALASVESQLVNDIQQAQKSLNKTQQQISQQAHKLNQTTQKLEQTVLSLRKKTATARRLVDEQTLSLTTLQKRLNTWQQQDTYQRNVVNRFASQQKLTPPSNDALSNANLAQLSKSFATIRQSLYPQWQTQAVVTHQGLIKQQPTLAIGPIGWFLDDNQAGFLLTDDNVLKHGLLLPSAQVEQLTLLSAQQTANISFDPTLTRALKIAQSQESVVEHIEKGGVWVLPILAFGLFALIISLAKGAQLLRLPQVIPALATRLSHIDTNQPDQVQQLQRQVSGMQRQLLDIAIATPAGQQRDDQLFSALLTHKHRLEYWLGAVAITAAVSPLLGLLGTVSGMIETFKLMTLFGAGDASAVSGGISEALVTTELGLVVAIPALLMHALLSRKVKTYYGDLEGCGVQLSQTNPQPLAEAA